MNYPETKLLTVYPNKDLHDMLYVNVNDIEIFKSFKKANVYFLDYVPEFSSNRWSTTDIIYNPSYPEISEYDSNTETTTTRPDYYFHGETSLEFNFFIFKLLI
jgi:hypothetical protein